MTALAIAPSPSPSPPPSSSTRSRTKSSTRRTTVVSFYRAGLNTDRIAHLTGLSRRRVSEIVKESIGQALEEAGTDGIRRQLYAELEMLKAPFRDALFFHSDDASPRERARLTGIILRLIHEQAVLMGVNAPKQQIAITHEQPVKNEQAEEYARGVVEYMRLADKIAASGYGSGRAKPTVDDELFLETNLHESTGTPELLLAYEAGLLEEEPSPEPARPARRQRVRPSRRPDDDDDDD